MGARARLLTAGAIFAFLAGCAACDSTTEPDDGGDRLYITSGFTDEVLRLDAADGRVTRTFSLERRRDEIDEPHGIAVAPDRRHWYATVAHGEPTLWKYELPDDRLVGRVDLRTNGAARIGITPDGRRAFIPDYYRSGMGQASGLAVVELEDLEVIARPTVCPAPHDAQVDPAGARVAIACSLSDEVVLMNAVTLEVTGRFYVDSDPGPPGAPRFKPLNLLWSPSGDTLYVGLFAAGQVRAFDPSGALLGTVGVGEGPAQIALTRDGRTLSVAFISYEGDVNGRGGVVAIDLPSGEIIWASEAGSYTLGIAYVPVD
jgi:DNA-binding beta-propeller fold protein YncE